jgi:hypothetical protein
LAVVVGAAAGVLVAAGVPLACAEAVAVAFALAVVVACAEAVAVAFTVGVGFRETVGVGVVELTVPVLLAAFTSVVLGSLANAFSISLTLSVALLLEIVTRVTLLAFAPFVPFRFSVSNVTVLPLYLFWIAVLIAL